MQRSSTIFMAKCVTILAVIPAVILASASGPEARHTGAPGDLGTCTACHAGQANPTGGSVQITAAEGSTYTPGQKQRMTVTITDTGATARLYGFQATARLASNLSRGQAGTLTPSNSETKVVCEDDRNAPCRTEAPLQFIEHSQAKSGNTYEFDWTPPASADAGPVTFYVAGNAANGNGQNTGDRIFTANITLTPGGASSGPKPAIQSSNGVQNGATFENNMVAGSWTTIKGTDLAQNTRIWLGSDFVNGAAPTELDGVKVNIDGKPAAVYFISPTQINVQAPDLGGKTGNVPVEVITRNGTSNTATGNVLSAAPGWFMFDPENRKYIAGTHADGTFLGKPGLFGSALTTRAAKPGDTIILYGANFGPTNPAMPTARAVDALSPLVATPTVTVGGMNAQISYGGAAPNFIGTYQFNIVVPDVPNGDQPVVVTLPGAARTQENAFITIQR